jgi:hypothetical protein
LELRRNERLRLNRFIAALIGLRWLAAEAGVLRPKRTGHAIRFPTPLIMRIVFGVSVPSALYGSSRIISEGNLAVGLIVLVLALTMLFVCPGEIVILRQAERARND